MLLADVGMTKFIYVVVIALIWFIVGYSIGKRHGKRNLAKKALGWVNKFLDIKATEG